MQPEGTRHRDEPCDFPHSGRYSRSRAPCCSALLQLSSIRCHRRATGSGPRPRDPPASCGPSSAGDYSTAAPEILLQITEAFICETHYFFQDKVSPGSSPKGANQQRPRPGENEAPRRLAVEDRAGEDERRRKREEDKRQNEAKKKQEEEKQRRRNEMERCGACPQAGGAAPAAPIDEAGQGILMDELWKLTDRGS